MVVNDGVTSYLAFHTISISATCYPSPRGAPFQRRSRCREHCWLRGIFYQCSLCFIVVLAQNCGVWSRWNCSRLCGRHCILAGWVCVCVCVCVQKKSGHRFKCVNLRVIFQGQRVYISRGKESLALVVLGTIWAWGGAQSRRESTWGEISNSELITFIFRHVYNPLSASIYTATFYGPCSPLPVHNIFPPW